MPNLTIDHRKIEVPEGTKVIEAAERLGIIIPRFCYHPALGSVGACRVCAVMFKDGPVKGLQMSCMTDAQDGMVVSTTDKEAVDFRRYVIEWLMLNHPHDCPVCDEGGHCLLQDQTISGGHGQRRYLGKKRTYYDQDLGPFVQHEMNRCIHCWRCRRFYQDFAGYRDLGAMQIGNRTYFGRFESGPLENPFAGNLIDLCPTGVYTDKPARFKARRWDMERSPSVCLHCSLGCNIVANAHYREIIRVEARVNDKINGHFICDRGRYGFGYADRSDRPRRPRLDGRETTWDEAIRKTAQSLSEIIARSGADAVLCLGSCRDSLETQAALVRFARTLSCPAPRFFPRVEEQRKVGNAVAALTSEAAVSMTEIEKSDFVVVIGADPINEAPMLALALRQAKRNGGAIAVLDPRPVSLPFPFDHLPVPPWRLNGSVDVLVKNALTHDIETGLSEKERHFSQALAERYTPDPSIHSRLIALSGKLQASQHPVMVCGNDIVPETTPARVAGHVRMLRAAQKEVGLFYLLPGPNAFGAALFSSPTAPGGSIATAIEEGTVKAMVAVEADPLYSALDQRRLVEALEKLEYLIVLDYLPSLIAQKAHALLPTLTLFEKEPKAAREILRQLAAAVSGQDKPVDYQDVRGWTVKDVLGFEPDAAGERHAGVRIITDKSVTLEGATEQPVFEGPPEGHISLLLVDRTFGTEELSSYSDYTRQVETPPALVMHAQDARRLHLNAGNRVSIQLPGGVVEAPLEVCENMASRVAVLPRHRNLDWQKLQEMPVTIPESAITRLHAEKSKSSEESVNA
jgi:NADH-quinone oxidoreductase subunit G